MDIFEVKLNSKVYLKKVLSFWNVLKKGDKTFNSIINYKKLNKSIKLLRMLSILLLLMGTLLKVWLHCLKITV
jgi:hypothetical protein